LIDINQIKGIKITLASPNQIRNWSHGEVKKPETINYRTLKPERDGLFCEKIFGPVRDFECYCGKYKRIRFRGIVCERCGVEVTHSRVRRERMGHIELAAPVAHIWFFKGVPSRMAYLLDISSKDLEKVIYFAVSIITHVDKKRIKEDLPILREELKKELEELDKERRGVIKNLKEEKEEKLAELKAQANPSPPQAEVRKLERKYKKEMEEVEKDYKERRRIATEALSTLEKLKEKQIIEDDEVYREMKYRYGDYFRGGMGAEAVRELLDQVDLEKEAEQLRKVLRRSKGQKRLKSIKRLKVISAFLRSQNKPSWMVLEVLPVLPPEIRPMVQLDGGRFASSDLNDLYRRVINRNNRLKKLLDLGAPEIIINNEKRMLQEAVDALFDNSRRSRPVVGSNNRPLKSLSDMLKGKQGRFRQNLLGKRVDYSGRSVIVVGPQLRLDQCGLPKVMALELFKPFVMKRLVELGHAPNIKGAKRVVERMKPVVWDVLEEVIKDQTVLLNRAPTLHRLGIQAFEPVLVEGKAIQIHPLVCPPYNADFDGDQMAVHVPLSIKAQAEARILMLSMHNALSPAHGRPLIAPTQDMVLGIYYLTAEGEGDLAGAGSFYADPDEAILAYQCGQVSLQAKITVRMREKGVNGRIETTVGRIIFNQALPLDYDFINQEVGKETIRSLVEEFYRRYEISQVAEILDNLKQLGFEYATKPGITISIDDMKVPPGKEKILEHHEKEADMVERQHRKGLITDEERHQRIVDIWNRATDEVTEAMEKNFSRFNPIYMMAQSGARGSIKQVRQLAGMRGLVANPKGEIIDRPIKSNFREGLSVLEYFISTHGARKGLADTALRTADSGYLTRRLVDVAQDIIVREEDCGSNQGLPVRVRNEENELNRNLIGRVALEAVPHPKTGEVLIKANQEIDEIRLNLLAEAGVEEIATRSVLYCRTRHGVCQLCYGWSLSDRKLVELGEAVGIVAAESIGEPGTQLTMRTFHTGGVAGEDITHGLPRVVELFEARKPKGQAVMAEVSGKVELKEGKRVRRVIIHTPDGKEKSYAIPRRARLKISHGDMVKAGDQLTEGPLKPHDILRIKGLQAVQLYLLEEIQKVYASQGVEINNKHIEIIIRQMLRKVSIVDSGDTDFLPGEIVDKFAFEEENQRVTAEGGKPATAKQILMGITKSALATESWLSAASFQETTRVLTDASVKGKVDELVGLKENVIIGKLIPAGTGMDVHRDILPDLEVPSEELRREEALRLLGSSATLPSDGKNVIDK
jgi:DNA-directed RNA polymerase subunit beta'